MTRWVRIKAFIKKGIKEWLKTFSNMDSLISAKRIERSFSFVFGCIIILTYFFSHLAVLTSFEAITLAAVFFTMAGYILDKIQKEKNDLPKD